MVEPDSSSRVASQDSLNPDANEVAVPLLPPTTQAEVHCENVATYVAPQQKHERAKSIDLTLARERENEILNLGGSNPTTRRNSITDQHNLNQEKSKSTTNAVRFSDSSENINLGWRCFPEIRHMSMPEGMTVEESKEKMQQAAEAFKNRVIAKGEEARVKYNEWKGIAFKHLPEWLRDNDFLRDGHRPPLPSVCLCFKSIFKIHTETGNIWTHLIGSILVVLVAISFVAQNDTRKVYAWTDVAVMMTFFTCACLCMTFSWLFHTLYCHSNRYRSIFSKLDYVGIAVLVVGSFVPWIYYGFYCSDLARLIYLSMINILGIICIIVSLWDRFATAFFRPVRAGMYVALGLSAVIPAIHFIWMYGFIESFEKASFGWILLMAFLYISGALIYVCRIPERFLPGKCDIWGHSHQIFHVFVVIAAGVHYYGVVQLANKRAKDPKCPNESVLAPVDPT